MNNDDDKVPTSLSEDNNLNGMKDSGVTGVSICPVEGKCVVAVSSSLETQLFFLSRFPNNLKFPFVLSSVLIISKI